MDSPQNDYGFDPNYNPYSGRAQQRPQVLNGPVGGAAPAAGGYNPQQMPGNLIRQPNPTQGAGSAYQPAPQGMDPNSPVLSYLSKMAAQKAF